MKIGHLFAVQFLLCSHIPIRSEIGRAFVSDDVIPFYPALLIEQLWSASRYTLDSNAYLLYTSRIFSVMNRCHEIVNAKFKQDLSLSSGLLLQKVCCERQLVDKFRFQISHISWEEVDATMLQQYSVEELRQGIKLRDKNNHSLQTFFKKALRDRNISFNTIFCYLPEQVLVELLCLKDRQYTLIQGLFLHRDLSGTCIQNGASCSFESLFFESIVTAMNAISNSVMHGYKAWQDFFPGDNTHMSIYETVEFYVIRYAYLVTSMLKTVEIQDFANQIAVPSLSQLVSNLQKTTLDLDLAKIESILSFQTFFLNGDYLNKSSLLALMRQKELFEFMKYPSITSELLPELLYCFQRREHTFDSVEFAKSLLCLPSDLAPRILLRLNLQKAYFTTLAFPVSQYHLLATLICHLDNIYLKASDESWYASLQNGMKLRQTLLSEYVNRPSKVKYILVNEMPYTAISDCNIANIIAHYESEVYTAQHLQITQYLKGLIAPKDESIDKASIINFEPLLLDYLAHEPEFLFEPDVFAGYSSVFEYCAIPDWQKTNCESVKRAIEQSMQYFVKLSSDKQVDFIYTLRAYHFLIRCMMNALLQSKPSLFESFSLIVIYLTSFFPLSDSSNDTKSFSDRLMSLREKGLNECQDTLLSRFFEISKTDNEQDLLNINLIVGKSYVSNKVITTQLRSYIQTEQNPHLVKTRQIVNERIRRRIRGY